MINTGLENRVVVVTGANNPLGIGAAIARACAGQGARIFLHFFRAPKPGTGGDAKQVGHASEPGETFYYTQSGMPGDEVLTSLSAFGVDAFAWEADLSRPVAAPSLFDKAEEALGPVEVLVHNAASWQADTFLDEKSELANPMVEMWTGRPGTLSAESFEHNFDVNTRAAALLMTEFARRHVARQGTWGRIITISTDGSHCFPSEVSYGASKLALEGYTRSAAVELGKYGITANIVSPGPIQTGWITPEMEKEIIQKIPMGRLGTPSDVADAVVYLASDQARWVTGQKIHVGGGHHV